MLVGKRLDPCHRFTQYKRVNVVGTYPHVSLQSRPVDGTPYPRMYSSLAGWQRAVRCDICKARSATAHTARPHEATHSSLHAFPPRISSTTRACSSAFPQLLRFTMLTISGAHPPLEPASFNRPTCSDAKTPNATSVCASTSFFCTSWKDARGRLNCMRSRAWARARSMQSWSAPMTPHEMP